MAARLGVFLAVCLQVAFSQPILPPQELIPGWNPLLYPGSTCNNALPFNAIPCGVTSEAVTNVANPCLAANLAAAKAAVSDIAPAFAASYIPQSGYPWWWNSAGLAPWGSPLGQIPLVPWGTCGPWASGYSVPLSAQRSPYDVLVNGWGHGYGYNALNSPFLGYPGQWWPWNH